MHTIEQDIIDEGVSLSHMPPDWIAMLKAHMMEHARQGRTGRALDYARGVLLTSPEDADSWVSVALLYRELGQVGMSARCLQHAEDLDATHRGARLERGELWVALGEPERGLDRIRDVFLEGFDANKPPAAQDFITLRAGAILETLQRVIAYRERESEPE